MLRPITEKRLYDCREPRRGPRFLVAGGAAHLLKLRKTAARRLPARQAAEPLP